MRLWFVSYVARKLLAGGSMEPLFSPWIAMRRGELADAGVQGVTPTVLRVRGAQGIALVAPGGFPFILLGI